jgi:uncharacterized repeat protein (TIGR03803 family)
VVFGNDGSLYGTTSEGGMGGGGTIFRIVISRFNSVTRQSSGSVLLSGTGPPQWKLSSVGQRKSVVAISILDPVNQRFLRQQRKLLLRGRERGHQRVSVLSAFRSLNFKSRRQHYRVTERCGTRNPKYPMKFLATFAGYCPCSW